MVDSRKIAILGAGRIGEALISGLLSSEWRKPGGDRRHRHAGPNGWPSSTSATASPRRSRTTTRRSGASLVVIAVKPQDIEGLLGEIGGLILPEQTVLTIAAAIPTALIESRLSRRRARRARDAEHPFDRARGHRRASAPARTRATSTSTSPRRRSRTSAPSFACPKRAMDAITAVSGSGPAYFALLAEAMIEAGILLGLAREISTQLVVQTMLGTAKQLRDEKMHPVELREMVTSPGGTTIAAIRELEMAGVRAAFLNAIQAAMVRSRELAAGEN